MRTTLNLPEQIITEGLRVTHIRTKTELITTAVIELIRKHKTSAIKKFKGSVDLKIDLNKLRDRA